MRRGLEQLFVDLRVLVGVPVEDAQPLYRDAHLRFCAAGRAKGGMGEVRELLRLGGDNLTYEDGGRWRRGLRCLRESWRG